MGLRLVGAVGTRINVKSPHTMVMDDSDLTLNQGSRGCKPHSFTTVWVIPFSQTDIIASIKQLVSWQDEAVLYTQVFMHYVG